MKLHNISVYIISVDTKHLQHDGLSLIASSPHHIYGGDNYVNEAPRGRPLLKDAICFGKLFIDSVEYLVRHLSYFPKAQFLLQLPVDNLVPLWELKKS